MIKCEKKIAYENIYEYMYTDIIVNRMVKIPIHQFWQGEMETLMTTGMMRP